MGVDDNNADQFTIGTTGFSKTGQTAITISASDVRFWGEDDAVTINSGDTERQQAITFGPTSTGPTALDTAGTGRNWRLKFRDSGDGQYYGIGAYTAAGLSQGLIYEASQIHLWQVNATGEMLLNDSKLDVYNNDIGLNTGEVIILDDDSVGDTTIAHDSLNSWVAISVDGTEVIRFKNTGPGNVDANGTVASNAFDWGTWGKPLALAGRVPCKVSLENGPIERGDLLTTSSTPGHAMKATELWRGGIVGTALQAFPSPQPSPQGGEGWGEGEHTGTIIVFCHLQSAPDNTEALRKEFEHKLQARDRRIDELEDLLRTLSPVTAPPRSDHPGAN
jgi:hypothetical protein